MPDYRCQVSLDTSSHQSEDRITNTWHFGANGTIDLADVVANVNLFYNTIDHLFSKDVMDSGHTLKFYDLAQAEPRVPVLVDTSLALVVDGVRDPAPRETAMCLSFKSFYQSGIPPARRRGRVYLGPFSNLIIGLNARPGDAPLGAIRDAGAALLYASSAANNWQWNIYSRVDHASWPVTAGWVDDEFDTQRRRGLRATKKVTF